MPGEQDNKKEDNFCSSFHKMMRILRDSRVLSKKFQLNGQMIGEDFQYSRCVGDGGYKKITFERYEPVSPGKIEGRKITSELNIPPNSNPQVTLHGSELNIIAPDAQSEKRVERIGNIPMPISMK